MKQLRIVGIPEQDNTMAVLQLRLLGFPLRNIRKCFSKLTGIPQREVARTLGKTRQLVTLTINGDRTKALDQEAIARAYNVPREVFFADEIDEN